MVRLVSRRQACSALIAGGFGLVPLMAMLRHRSAIGGSAPARLIVSARSEADVPYAAELERLRSSDHTLEVAEVLTRSALREPPGSRRLNRERLMDLAYPPTDEPNVFICGPTGFVETVARALVELGHDPAAIRTERFGPSGEETTLRAA